MDIFAAIAGEKPIEEGLFRVVVSSGGRISVIDFRGRAEAEQYADDVAAEWSDEPQVAVVFDDNLTPIRRGKPYFAK